MKDIKFITKPYAYNPDKVFVALLLDVNSTKELFNQLSDKLNFPDYFGFNWDALLDMFCDFSWIENKDIMLIHESVPTLGETSLQIYLDILVESVKSWQNWKGGSVHHFEVIFPKEAEIEILKFLKD